MAGRAKQCEVRHLGRSRTKDGQWAKVVSFEAGILETAIASSVVIAADVATNLIAKPPLLEELLTQLFTPFYPPMRPGDGLAFGEDLLVGLYLWDAEDLGRLPDERSARAGGGRVVSEAFPDGLIRL